MNYQNRLRQIALTKIPMVGAITAKNLVSYCGSVDAVFEATKRELLKIPGIGAQTAAAIINHDPFKAAEAELEFLEKYDIRSFFYLDKTYPARLRNFPESPVILYYKGTADLNFERTVGIVGTRQPTAQGIAICEELVENLAAYDVMIISGLAYGIDITAHKKCLEKNIPTLGVLGNGLAKIYPAAHKSAAEKMMENGGVLTEFAHHVGPDRENFPMRNRIIAGLSDALIVVETASKGGSIITAHIANNYNKDVFAVPGRLKDKYSQGCNHLIKTNQAALIESAEDVAYIMRWQAEAQAGPKQAELFAELSENERKVIELLRENDEVNIDKLCYEAGQSTSQMAALLLELEFKGFVKTLPGKRYILV